MPLLRGVTEQRLALGRREKRVIKVRALAERLGMDETGKPNCSASHLTSVENGYRPASPEMAELIAVHLGCTVKPADDGTGDLVLVPTATVPDTPPVQPTIPKAPPPRRKKENKGPRRAGDELLRGVA